MRRLGLTCPLHFSGYFVRYAYLNASQLRRFGRNYRIEVTRSLNQDCVFALDLESILLTSLLQNPFSTASVMTDKTQSGSALLPES
jgi:hypothetical protein